MRNYSIFSKRFSGIKYQLSFAFLFDYTIFPSETIVKSRGSVAIFVAEIRLGKFSGPSL